MEGVSSLSTTWFSRVKPSPFTTSLCFFGVHILARMYLMRIVFFAAVICLQLLSGRAAHAGDFFPVAQLLQGIKSGLDYVMRVGCANGFGQHILNASRGHDRAH